MRLRTGNRFDAVNRVPAGTQASARLILLVVLAFAFGAGLTAVWFYRSKPAAPTNSQPGAEPATRLSGSTQAVLARLNGPLQVRFYAVLDPASVPESTQVFAQRASQLLGEYEQEAGGKLKLTRYDSFSRTNQNAAAKDGLQAFNTDKGEACYLGVALALQGQKEVLAQLSPEWESALESDLTRAIARLIEANVPAPGPVTQDNSAAEKEVQALIPNVAAVSVEQGTRTIRENALKSFREVAAEMEARVKEAQQQLADAQNGKSDAEQQAAMQHLQQVQAEQAAKLKAIAAQSQAEIEALKRLKARP
jgi:hypothetical protein